MKQTVYTLSLAATLTLASFLPGLAVDPASASKLTDLKNQKTQINQEKSAVSSDINEADQKINSIKSEQEGVKTEKQRLDLAIGDTNTKLLQKSSEIETTKGEIQQLQTEVQQITERINKRNEMLKERARSFQENGGMVNYMDVLMGAQSFGEFIDRVGAVATLVEADQDILRQQKQDKQLLEDKQVQVQNDLASLQKMVADLEALKVELNGQIAQQDQIMASLQQQEEQAHAEKLEKEEQAEILAAQQAAIQQAIKMEEQRIKDEAAKQQQQQASSGNTGGSTGGTSTATPGVSSGYWTKPAVGTLTSGLGMRWGSFHAGIDIANKVSVPILAAADGVVIRSYYSSSYGNCIFISHYNNGQVYTTVYAHMNTRLVSGGAVKKGQQIGTMGNTGDSTGQHLHFELHVGEWNAAKSNAVNPLNYIPM